MKFLGVNLDPSLNWSYHIKSLQSKLQPLCCLFYRCSQHLPAPILLLFYNSFVNSLLSYCIEVWGNAPAKYTNPIFINQKKLLRMIYKKDTFYPSKNLFIKSSTLSIYKLYEYRILIRAYSSHHAYISNSSPYYHTRQSHINLPIPRSHSAAGHRTTTYQESLLWNQLPPSIKTSDSISIFKKRLKTLLLGRG